MSLMGDPTIILESLQQAINEGMAIDPSELDSGYKFYYDEPGDGRRFSFVKIHDNEVQALAIFGLEDPIERLTCYNVGYAVKDSCRGRGLAVEAVNHGLDRLIRHLIKEGLSRFYLEAIIAQSNLHSINVTKKLFPAKPEPIIDGESGTPSFQFKRLIVI